MSGTERTGRPGRSGSGLLRTICHIPAYVLEAADRERSHRFYHFRSFFKMLFYSVFPTAVAFSIVLLGAFGTLYRWELIVGLVCFGLPLELCRRDLRDSYEKDIAIRDLTETIDGYRSMLKRTKRVRKHRNDDEFQETLNSERTDGSSRLGKKGRKYHDRNN